MKNNRLIVPALILLVLLVVAGVFGVLLRGGNQPTKSFASGDSITYTDDITGSSASDIPGESGDLTGGQIATANVSIMGIDSLSTYMNDDQFNTAQAGLTNFLAARSGLTTVHAGIENNAITQSNDVISFVIQADRPQASYDVTIKTPDASSSPQINITATNP